MRFDFERRVSISLVEFFELISWVDWNPICHSLSTHILTSSSLKYTFHLSYSNSILRWKSVWTKNLSLFSISLSLFCWHFLLYFFSLVIIPKYFSFERWIKPPLALYWLLVLSFFLSLSKLCKVIKGLFTCLLPQIKTLITSLKNMASVATSLHCPSFKWIHFLNLKNVSAEFYTFFV